MIRNALRAVIATIVLVVITGVVYPLVMTAVGQTVFKHQANGSVVQAPGGTAVGSGLIGQEWKGPQWFYGRPSAVGYNASTSGGSNLGPNSRQLAQDIEQRATAIIALEGPYHQGLTAAGIPSDLLVASGSGLDPDISPAAAAFQAPRVAAARHLPVQQVNQLIALHTQGKTLGFLGEPRVNVLELNAALNQLSG
jgi:K+-transporting ATPase ATPase C chain